MLAVLLLVAFILAIAAVGRLPEGGRSARAEFVRALRGERPVEGRLSWGFSYAPYRPREPILRKPGATRRGLLRSPWSKAASALAAEAAESESSAALASRAVLLLVRGRPPEAATLLERAVRLAPGDARLLSDLAAVRIELARSQDDTSILILALQAADLAARKEPQLAEAQFNRALVLERLSLSASARSAWSQYLEADSASGWAREASARVAALAGAARAQGWPELKELISGNDKEALARAAQDYPHELRQYVEETLLGEWADALRKGQPGQAADLLAASREIGRVLAASRAEFLVADAVHAIDRTRSAPQALAALAAGIRAYRDARPLYAQLRLSEADSHFIKAQDLLAKAGSPTSKLASLYIAIDEFQRRDLDPALAKLLALVRDPGNRRYPSLLERTWWALALVQAGRGELASSLDAYRRALEVAARAGGVEDTAGLYAAAAETWRFLGQPREAWRSLGHALSLRPRIGSFSRHHALLTEAADACVDAGLWEAAFHFRDETLHVLERKGEPVRLAHALLRRSEALHHLGEDARAQQDLARATAELSRMDKDMGRRIEADLLLAQTEVRQDTDPASAEASMSRALEFYGGPSDHLLVGRLLRARGRFRRAAGDLSGAEKDFASSITDYELRRPRVSNESLQISFFEQSGSAFDDLIDLLSRQPQRMESAFGYAERKRARALLDRVSGVPAEARRRVLERGREPLSAQELRERIPPGIALLEYTVLRDRLLVWVVRSGRIRQASISIRSSELESLVEEFRGGIFQSERESAAAYRLFDILIRPVLGSVSADDQLVLLPDKFLHRVPFAALVDRSTGHFLVQDRTIAVAPSATLFLESMGRSRRPGHRGPPSALAVGNPLFDRAYSPQLPELPEAEAEAREIAELLPGSELLIGPDATTARFLDAAAHHEIVHFAGHAMVNGSQPLLSYLLMAPGGGDDHGLLFSHQLYETHLEKTRLVILAGCHTADGPAGNEGVLSLARSFLAAGVPTIVATLWEVKDVATAKLFRVFYRQMQTGKDPAVALRRAQVAMLLGRSSALPREWAGFEVIGGLEGERRDRRGPYGDS